MAHQCNAVASSLLALAHADSEPAPDLGLGHARTLSIARSGARRGSDASAGVSRSRGAATAIDGWRACAAAGAALRCAHLALDERAAGTVPPPRPLARLNPRDARPLAESPDGARSRRTRRARHSAPPGLGLKSPDRGVPDSLTRLTRHQARPRQPPDPDAEALAALMEARVQSAPERPWVRTPTVAAGRALAGPPRWCRRRAAGRGLVGTRRARARRQPARALPRRPCARGGAGTSRPRARRPALASLPLR